MKYNKLIGTILCACCMMSCNDDLLNKTSLTSITEDAVWADPELIQTFVNARYNQVGHGWTESWMSSCIDETALTWSRGCEQINLGTITSSDIGRMNGGWYGWDHRAWDTEWANIQNCNLFFQNVDNATFTDEDWRTRMKGEVRFIRVLMYHDLTRRWGGLPIITDYYTLSDEKAILNVKRDSYEDCVNWMVAQLDSAATELPGSYSDADDNGRTTQAAALALKSRILLYAASDLMNVDVDNELVGYVGSSETQAERWSKAAVAAQEAIDNALENGFALYKKYSDPAENYKNIFMDRLNSEVLFARQGTSSADEENLSYLDQSNFPSGYNGWGGNCPMESFVDAFECLSADGTTATDFSWKNFKDTFNIAGGATPWDHRDPRLKATVLYDGVAWSSRNMELFYAAYINGKDTTICSTWKSLSGVTIGSGKDTDRYPTNSWNSSLTGYNVKKFVDEDYVSDSWNFSARDWIWLRLGEQYLNLAEALCETGDYQGARNALDVIRNRAGMPDVSASMSGETLLSKIRHERRIELCFEEHRYFDVRRWKLGSTLAAPNTKIDIYKLYNNDKFDGTGNVTGYLYLPKHSVIETRIWNDKLYWLPIPYSEITKNPNLIQNPKY